jgi:hypothetical protein
MMPSETGLKETLQWWAVTDGRETLKESHVRERSIIYH